MQVFGQYMQCLFSLVDVRLHCYGGEYVADSWNNAKRAIFSRCPENNGKSPAAALRDSFPESWHRIIPESVARRFGCLVFYKIEPKPTGKLSAHIRGGNRQFQKEHRLVGSSYSVISFREKST